MFQPQIADLNIQATYKKRKQEDLHGILKTLKIKDKRTYLLDIVGVHNNKDAKKSDGNEQIHILKSSPDFWG